MLRINMQLTNLKSIFYISFLKIKTVSKFRKYYDFFGINSV